MAIEATRALQECLNTCEKLKGNMEREKATASECLSGEILKAYIEAVNESKNAVSKIENQVSILHTSSQMEL